MTRFLIVDQFCGLSPYWLQVHPLSFDDVAAHALAQTSDWMRHKPRVLEAETCEAEWCQTVFREREDGMAEFWRANWDSSG